MTLFLILVAFALSNWLLCCSTIRRWRKGHAVEFWEAHKVAVQAVLKLSTGEFVTGNSFNDVMSWLELLDLVIVNFDSFCDLKAQVFSQMFNLFNTK